MINFPEVMRQLAEKRPIFHNEADFQHALAWELHERYPTLSVRLEYRPPHVSKRMNTDICLDGGYEQIVIELKYKTRRLKTETNGELFDLLDQSARIWETTTS